MTFKTEGIILLINIKIKINYNIKLLVKMFSYFFNIILFFTFFFISY